MENTHHRFLSENATPSFCDMLIAWEKSVKQQLAAHLKNLEHLEFQATQYGLDIPLPLLNEIKHTRAQIDHLMKELQGREGILPVLKALSRSEKLAPLLHHLADDLR